MILGSCVELSRRDRAYGQAAGCVWKTSKSKNMSYWVYENWVATNRAVIHRGTCGYCNDGKGCHELLHEDKNGKWHGPFETLGDARNIAASTQRPVLECSRCVERRLRIRN